MPKSVSGGGKKTRTYIDTTHGAPRTYTAPTDRPITVAEAKAHAAARRAERRSAVSDPHTGQGALAAATGGGYAFDKPAVLRPEDVHTLHVAAQKNPGVRMVGQIVSDPSGLIGLTGAVNELRKHPGVGTGVGAGISAAGLFLPGLRRAKNVKPLAEARKGLKAGGKSAAVTREVDLNASLRAGKFLDKSGKEFGPEDEVTLYHGTSAATAAKLRAEGFKPGSKVTREPTIVKDETLAKMLGKKVGDPIDYEPGRGLGKGLYLSPSAKETAVFGDTVVPVRVKVKHLGVAPERAASGRNTPLKSLLLNDGYVEHPIAPHQFGAAIGKAEAKPLAEEAASEVKGAKELRGALAGKTPKMGKYEKVGAKLEDPNLGKTAAQLRAEQEKGYSVERSKRIKEAERLMNEVGGEEGHKLALQALKGDLPKLEFAAGKELNRDNLPDLFAHIQEHPGLRPFERVRTRSALLRILEGKVPTRSEIRLLGVAFGEDDAKALAGSVGLWRKLGNEGLQLLNVPRALKSSFDLSAPFRQGLVLGARHPRMFASEFKPMIKAFGSEHAYQDVMDDIASRPTFPLMQQAKLALTDLEDIANREEAFASRLAEAVPGVRHSGRAYTAFLNKFRADAFDSYIRVAEANGLDTSDPKVTQSIARWVNYATGRGGQSKFVSSHAVGLNAMLFSPRLIASRVNLLANPKFYADLDPFARKQALRGMAQLVGGISLTLYMAKLAGAKVGVDPRSADFGKIKVGNTRVDVMGGFQQYIVLAARMIQGETVSSSTGAVEHLTGGFGKPSRGTLASRFAQQKLAPVPGFAAGWLNNENFAGQPFQPAKEAGLLLAPLGIENAVDTYRQEGGKAAAAGFALGSVGFGVQTYGPQADKDLKNAVKTIDSAVRAGRLSPERAADAKRQLRRVTWLQKHDSAKNRRLYLIEQLHERGYDVGGINGVLTHSGYDPTNMDEVHEAELAVLEAEATR